MAKSLFVENLAYNIYNKRTIKIFAEFTEKIGADIVGYPKIYKENFKKQWKTCGIWKKDTTN